MLTKTLAAISAFGVLAQGHAALAAPEVTARPFELKLRRSIAVQGMDKATFEIAERMAHYRVPGVSVAVIEGCSIVDARAFGRSADGRLITNRTLFQAGSISKSVTAVAALKLAEHGKLPLDSEIGPLLKSWKLPASSLLAGHPITVRALLNHTAGLNEIGGKGYARGDPLPTVAQILDGTPPANTPPVSVVKTPGTQWVYSSGGYYLVQALMTDVTGEAFPPLIDELVLKPARMKESSFGQPLDAVRAQLAASAVGPDGSAMSGGWRVNPELAAGGLWSTPSDLARFIIALARSVRGESGFLSADSARQMMTRGLGNWGLGVDLGHSEGPHRFGHTGHNVGFVSEYVMYPDTCQGAVVMTNADEGGWLVSEVLRAIGDTYGWPGREPSPIEAAIPMSDAIAARFVGTYRLRDFPAEQFTVSRKEDGTLYWARIGHIGRDLLPQSATLLFSPDSRMTLVAPDQSEARAMTLELTFGGGKNVAVRVD